MRYYVCYLTDGGEQDFGKKCTDVSWDDTIFRAFDDAGICP